MNIEITNVYQKEALTNIINRYGNFSYIDAKDIVKQIEINKSNTPIKIYDIPDYLFNHMYRICEFKKINKEVQPVEVDEEKMEKHQFKPFDKVLARDNDEQCWNAALYSHSIENSTHSHKCIGDSYAQCIPYNENTAHLLGTCKPYEEPEPKVWHVVNRSGSFNEVYTAEEFANFIKTAVINNKDITNFHVTYINPND